MKAHELMLGNLIQRKEIGKVIKIDGDFITTDKEHDVISCFKPVPLTTKLLIKYKFEIDKQWGDFWRFRDGVGLYYKNGVWCYSTTNLFRQIKYVHKLQNLFLDLTSKKLIK